MDCKQIEDKIKQNLEITSVEAKSSDNIHFNLTVVSNKFEGLSKIKQHKIIMDLFAGEIANQEIHALSIKTLIK